MDWQSITSAPFGVDLEICVIENGEVCAQIFPCRRVGNWWYNADTRERALVEPTHWRYWLVANGAKR